MDQLGVKPWIKGSYDLRGDEPSDHSISRTYCDCQIRYLQMHTKEAHSDTMFEYTRYFQNTEHLEKPLKQTNHRSTQ